jgi:selenocysteine lyase/cysteine desulfurase
MTAQTPPEKDWHIDLERLRAETPGCSSRVHLNNAGASLMSSPVIRAITTHLELEAELGGYEAQDAQSEEIAAAYQAIARLIGGSARNIAFTENATASFAQALSAVPFNRDDIILTTRNDYASNQIQFLSLQARLGVRVIHAPDKPQGGVDTSKMIDLIEQHRPKIVCVTHVPTNSGLIQDIQTVGAACRSAGVIYLVDACQSVGQMPIDVGDIGCDFLSATARKFLRGPRGCGFLYVSDRILQQGLEPLFIDMHGASWTGENSYQAIDSAKRFENWEFAWSLVLGTAVAAEYATSIGIGAIQSRVASLLGLLRRELSEIDGVDVLGNDDELGGIVTITVQDCDPTKIVTRLRSQNINVSAQGREHAVIDYDKKKVAGALRISPHYYNTNAEIESLLRAIESVSTSPD